MTDQNEKSVRLKAFSQWDTEVEILVKIGTKRFPLSVDGARALRRKLNEALGGQP